MTWPVYAQLRSYIFEILPKYIINKIDIKYIKIISVILLPINKRILVLASAEEEQNRLLDRNWLVENDMSPP